MITIELYKKIEILKEQTKKQEAEKCLLFSYFSGMIFIIKQCDSHIKSIINEFLVYLISVTYANRDTILLSWRKIYRFSLSYYIQTTHRILFFFKFEYQNLDYNISWIIQVDKLQCNYGKNLISRSCHYKWLEGWNISCWRRIIEKNT